METVCLSPSIMSLIRTPAEKILLARICQRALLAAGVCSDTNNELAQATAMHLKTVSDLIGRLVEAELISTMVDKEQANRRNLMPRQDLLTDYPSITDRGTDDYPSITDRVNASPKDYPSNTDRVSSRNHKQSGLRLCPITGIDITHQRPDCRVATNTTLNKLLRNNKRAYHDLVARLLGPGEWMNAYLLSFHVRKLAKASSRSLFARKCPLSGADISQQGISYPFVTANTIRNIFKRDRSAFEAMFSRLGLAYNSHESMATLCLSVTLRVRELALTHTPDYPTQYRSEPLTHMASTVDISLRRFCPLTGIDITYQQSRYRVAMTPAISQFFETNRADFDQLIVKFFPGSILAGNASQLIHALSALVSQIAQEYQS